MQLKVTKFYDKIIFLYRLLKHTEIIFLGGNIPLNTKLLIEKNVSNVSVKNSEIFILIVYKIDNADCFVHFQIWPWVRRLCMHVAGDTYWLSLIAKVLKPIVVTYLSIKNSIKNTVWTLWSTFLYTDIYRNHRKKIKI